MFRIISLEVNSHVQYQNMDGEYSNKLLHFYYFYHWCLDRHESVSCLFVRFLFC